MSEQMTKAWVQLNVRLPKQLDNELKAQARREDRPISWIVRRALRQYLSQKPAGDARASPSA